jgi:hypothetical protein
MVCPECHAVEPLSRPIINAMKCRQPVPCAKCGQAEMRFKVGAWAGGVPTSFCCKLAIVGRKPSKAGFPHLCWAQFVMPRVATAPRP